MPKTECSNPPNSLKNSRWSKLPAHREFWSISCNATMSGFNSASNRAIFNNVERIIRRVVIP